MECLDEYEETFHDVEVALAESIGNILDRLKKSDVPACEICGRVSLLSAVVNACALMADEKGEGVSLTVLAMGISRGLGYPTKSQMLDIAKQLVVLYEKNINEEVVH